MSKKTITPQRDQIAIAVNRLLAEVDPAADPKPVIDLIEKVATKNKLNVARWESFPLGDLGHDIYGIIRHGSGTTGELFDCFWPRCGGLK